MKLERYMPRCHTGSDTTWWLRYYHPRMRPWQCVRLRLFVSVSLFVLQVQLLKALT